VLGGEGGGELMERMAAKVGCSRMDPCEPAMSLVATLGSWPAAMQLSVEPPQLTQRAFKGTGVRDDGSGGEHGQVPDADVHSDHVVPATAPWEPPLYFTGEGDEPAVGGPGHRGRHNAGGAVLDSAGELSRRFVSLEYPDPRQLDMLAVAQHADGTSGEPAGLVAMRSLPPREPHRTPFPAAVL
jgi:hypothetical protein